MADEPRYSDELRIPISITLPWSGRLTKNGTPWPKDRSGRDWPKGRTGNPVFPICDLPKGFAPGTNEIYQRALSGTARPVTEQFAAMDAAMWAELRRVAAKMSARQRADESLKPDGLQAVAPIIMAEADEPSGEDEPREAKPPGLSPGDPVLPTPDFTRGEEASPTPRRSVIARAGKSKTAGFERQLALHRQKLPDYIANPDAHDNKNLLPGASPEDRQKTIANRVQSLEGQIRFYEREIARRKGE